MKKFLTKLEPFVPAIIMMVIIIISLIVVLSFGIRVDDNRNPQQSYIDNKSGRNNLLIVSIVLDFIILSFYLLEVKFRKTVLKWIFFNASFFLMIAASFLLAMSMFPTTCHSLFIMIGIPFLNFFLFIASFICAFFFLKPKQKENA